VLRLSLSARCCILEHEKVLKHSNQCLLSIQEKFVYLGVIPIHLYHLHRLLNVIVMNLLVCELHLHVLLPQSHEDGCALFSDLLVGVFKHFSDVFP